MHRRPEALTQESRTTRPLDGVIVISVEQAVAGPLCTLRLGDAGARIIKIEAPGGDRARYYDQAMGGTSACFAWLNRGKESAVLDLKSAADLALVKRMIARADVFVQNLAPGATTRLGLRAADLTAVFPRLIVVDIMGYGSRAIRMATSAPMTCWCRQRAAFAPSPALRTRHPRSAYRSPTSAPACMLTPRCSRR